MRGFIKRHKILTSVLCVLLVVFVLVASAGYWRLSTILIPYEEFPYNEDFMDPQTLRYGTAFIGTVLEVEEDETFAKNTLGIPVSVAKVQVERVLKYDVLPEVHISYEGGVLPIEDYIRATYPSEEENQHSFCGNTGPSSEYVLEHLQEFEPFKKRAAYFTPLYRKIKKGRRFLFLFYAHYAEMDAGDRLPFSDYDVWQIKGKTIYRPDGQSWGDLDEFLAAIHPEKDEPPN